MARHRNIRSMNYSEECEGYDDVYGHSVEDDYCVSPSVAEQFIYDRNRRPQMSAFLGQEEEIAEEDEEEEDGEEHQHGTGGVPKCAMVSGAKGLSDMDYARLQSCLEEVRNVIGDSIAEQTMIEAVLSSDFNVEKALNMVLNNATEVDHSGALKTSKADQRKEKDVCLNCNSYSPQKGSNNNACPIPGSEVSLTAPIVGGSDCHNEVGVGEGGSISSMQGVTMEKEDNPFPLHPSGPPSAGYVLPSLTEDDGRGDGDDGSQEGAVFVSDPSQLKQVLSSNLPQSDSDDEDTAFPSLHSLVIHNTSSHDAKPPSFVWPTTGLQIETGDDSEDSTDEFSSLCSLVVHNRSESVPALPKVHVPFTVPPLLRIPGKTDIEPKAAIPLLPQCPSDPSSEEEDDFSSLHSLVIRNRSASIGDENRENVGGMPQEQIKSLSMPPQVISGSCVGQSSPLSEIMEVRDSDSDEEDNYSSLCSLVIHNRKAQSEVSNPKGRIPPCDSIQETALAVPSWESGRKGCAQEVMDKMQSEPFVIPTLLVMSKSGVSGVSSGPNFEKGSEVSEEEDDYVIDLCGTLKSMDVKSISSVEESDAEDVPVETKIPSGVDESGKKEMKWRILHEGWVQEPVENMRLLDVNSGKLSPFGRVLCKNWDCLKQLECPEKRDTVIGNCSTLVFHFDKESPDDICRRLRSQKYLIQVKAAKFTSILTTCWFPNCPLVMFSPLGTLFLAPKKQVVGLKEEEEGGGVGGGAGDGGMHHPTRADAATIPVAVVVVPAAIKTITKGFDIKGSKPNSRELSPRSQSPAPAGDKRVPDEEVPEERSMPMAGEDPIAADRDNITPLKSRGTVDAVSQYAKERGGEGKKELLHMVVVGHVDAGKSTLMGHLLYALGQVNKRVMHKYEQESKKLGKQSFVYAWILDETGEERSRGITMDVGQNRFDTPTKSVVLLDAPGHRDFIPNMISGAARADVALLVVDATRGEFETGFESGGQTREHALLVRSLGVSQLAVAVNKMDNVGWSQERFSEVASKLGTFLKQAGFREGDITFVPCSGLVGQNLAVAPTEEALLKWYSGPCLLDVIDNFKTPPRPIVKPFRMSVNDIFKGTGSGFCVSGRVETGTLQLGDRVLVQPQGELAQIKGIAIDELPAQVTFAGDQPCVTLSGIDMQNVMVGYILSDPANPLPVTSRITARIVVFNIKVPITRGFPVVFHHQSLLEQAVITKLIAQLNKSTGEVVKKHPRCLTKNSNATVEIETARPICVELYRDVKELGRFMLRSGGLTIAAGLVTQIH
ncbi:uncharacterized protein HBS1 [Hetaerina americana]|uniref:uncharacterized protein HBS1 n=1 Tax=Hetaerina americana TaxID=62018 RepID=UPI003A7F53E0